MNRLLRFFASRSFAILLFHLGLLFFMWPILSIPAEDGGPGIFNYIFTVWAVLVFTLFLIGTSIRITKHKKEDSDDA